MLATRHLRLLRRLDPYRVRTELADDLLGDDPVLAAVLVAAQQLLAEVVVDRGVGAAPGRPGEGDGGSAGAGAADQQLGAGADERRLRRSAAEAEAGGEVLAEGAEDRRRVVGGGRGDDHLAGEDHLLEGAGADPLGRLRDRVLEITRRTGAADLRPLGAVRVDQGQRLGPQPRDPAFGALRRRLEVVAGTDEDVDREVGLLPHRQIETSGSRIVAGLNEDQDEEPAPSGSNAKPPVQTGPAPAGRSPGSSTTAPSATRRHSRATSPNRAGPREVDSWATPSAARANSRSGCSQQNQRSEASREAKTVAQGSISRRRP